MLAGLCRLLHLLSCRLALGNVNWAGIHRCQRARRGDGRHLPENIAHPRVKSICLTVLAHLGKLGLMLGLERLCCRRHKRKHGHDHVPVIASLPGGTKIGSGESVQIQLQTKSGTPFSEVLTDIDNGQSFLPDWTVTKGESVVSVSESGTITALAPGDATVEGKIPGVRKSSW